MVAHRLNLASQPFKFGSLSVLKYTETCKKMVFIRLLASAIEVSLAQGRSQTFQNEGAARGAEG